MWSSRVLSTMLPYTGCPTSLSLSLYQLFIVFSYMKWNHKFLWTSHDSAAIFSLWIPLQQKVHLKLDFWSENFFSHVWQGKKSMSWRHHSAIAHTSTRIEFHEALIRFSKLGFPVAHQKFLSLQYEDYKFLVDARAAARSGKIFLIN